MDCLLNVLIAIYGNSYWEGRYGNCIFGLRRIFIFLCLPWIGKILLSLQVGKRATVVAVSRQFMDL